MHEIKDFAQVVTNIAHEVDYGSHLRIDLNVSY